MKCYRTLQSCHYDPLLTSCLLSNCTVVSRVNTTVNESYPLTNYRLSCRANIYYKTRCIDSPASSGLYYSSSQQNSVCRQQRMNRINTCLNSNVQLLHVPCLISVSSGRVTNTSNTCNQTVTGGSLILNFSTTTTADPQVILNPDPTSRYEPVIRTSPTTFFSASDQDEGHVYRI